MPRNARIAAVTATAIGLAFLLAAIWFPENVWKFALSAVVMVVVAICITAVNHPDARK